MELDNIAASIRKARLQAGLTQKDVASALGKGQTTVASWETGRSQPDAATIIFLSNLFDVSSDYLLGVSGAANPPEKDMISDRIRSRRQQLGINIENLAKQLNAPVYVIQRYENGEFPKSWESIMEVVPPLASALQCSPAYIMGWEHFAGPLGKDNHYIDAIMPVIDIADRTGFDRFVMENAFKEIKKSEGIAIFEKIFSPDVYRALIARARELQTEQNISYIRKSFSSLDVEGQKEAVKRVEELTEIPKYRRKDD